MTFSILAKDPKSGAIGGAAATGSLCVGGWVLRGSLAGGMSASQGAAPSTFWGDEVIAEMAAGHPAAEAVNMVTGRDGGRSWRQLAAMDINGHSGAFTGEDNTDAKGARTMSAGIVAGNLLADDLVLDAIARGYATTVGEFASRLLGALAAGEAAGSDSRGLMSAALLVLRPDHAPLSLRIDYSSAPLDDLRALLARATSGDYAAWAKQVPCRDDPERVLGSG